MNIVQRRIPGMRRLGLLVSVSLYAVLQASAGQCAEPAAADGTLEEVIVTAQKRSESIQSVPISITAISSETLDRTHAINLAGLQGSIPNVQIGNFTNTPNSSVFTIRGIGVIEPDPYAGQTVSVVMDGVPQYFNMVSLLDLFDIERVEILRGPQGTLFGANTTGGVINVLTQPPTGIYGGKAMVTAGNYHRLDVDASVDIPIVDDVLAGKVSVVHNGRDGFVTNVVNGKDIDSLNVTAIRGSLRYTPGSNFDATLIGEYDRARNGAPLHIEASRPGELGYVAPGTQPMGAALPQPASPCIVPNQRCRAPDKYFGGDNDNGFSNLDTYSATLTMNGDSSWGKITSITGYKKFRLNEMTDQDGSALLLSGTIRTTEAWQISQEVRNTFHPFENVEVLVGAFALIDHYDQIARYHVHFAAPNIRQDTSQDQRNWSGSLYTQAYWQVTDKLRLQAGVRYTHEHTKMTVDVDNFVVPPIQYFGGLNVGGFKVSDKKSWDNVGGKFGLDYKVNEDLMLYGYYARGFKSGGFVGRISGPEFLGPYDPEYVDTVEAGVKSDWLDERLRINLSAFQTWYKDMQLANVFFTTDALGNTVNGNTILNAGSAIIRGFELETTVIPTRGLTLNGSVSYLDAHYTNFIFNDPFGPRQDLKGYRLQNAPRWSATAGFSYELPSGPGHTRVGMQYRFTGSKFNNALNDTPRSFIQPTHYVDANIDWKPTTGNWSIGLWGRNLLDKRYLASVVDAPGILGLASYAPPREYGATLKVEW
jgi:iron complex outermembrane receptor protein